MNTSKRIVLPLVVILVVLLQLATPGLALAQDEVPPVTEAPVDPGTGETPPVEEPPSVPEILEEAPPGTEIVVVGENGVAEPLATVEAAAIIANSDPVWCPVGALPGDPTCTTNQADVTILLAYLLDPDSDPLTPTPYTGAGTIYFQNGTYGGAEPTITFANTALPALTNLTLEGGWDLGTNTKVSGGSTTFTVPVTVDWAADVTLQDLVFQPGAATPASLYVATSGGDITIDNVDVISNPGGNGAVLDTAYITGPAIGDMLGAGDVTITNSEFTGNLSSANPAAVSGVGLFVTANGSVSLNNVVADSNGNTGLYVDNCLDFFGVGCVPNDDVTVNLSEFDVNGGNGIYVDSGGSIVLDNVSADANGANGATLANDEAHGAGNDVTVTTSTFSGNDNYGLYVQSAGNVTIGDATAAVVPDVTANNNLYNSGVYVTTTGNVAVQRGSFDGNGLGLGGDGLTLEVQGNITLQDVTANSNRWDGAYLVTQGTSAVTLTNSDFHYNGEYGINAHSQDGDITLSTVTANYNAIKGAYLDAACTCTGDIFVNGGSVFAGNGSYGLYAVTQQGNITLDNVTVDGDGDPSPTIVDPTTSIGAFLISYGGGVITVQDSNFANTTGYGLEVVGTFGGPGPAIQLTDIMIRDNGDDGAHLLSGWVFGCFGPMNIEAAVDGGTYQNNASYGIYAAPGPAGVLTLSGAITFAANTNGDTFVDLFDPCVPEPPKPPEPPSLPVNVVEVPDTGGTPVEVNCDDFSATVLILPNGDEVRYTCPGGGMFIIHHLNQGELPAPLAVGPRFVAAMGVDVSQDGAPKIVEEEGGYFLVTFQIPANMADEQFSILYWDPTAKSGEGDWIELPRDRFRGESYPLHPETPEDEMLILRGVRQQGNTVTVKVNFTGTFVLVAR